MKDWDRSVNSVGDEATTPLKGHQVNIAETHQHLEEGPGRVSQLNDIVYVYAR